jgi:hypothetical protein
MEFAPDSAYRPRHASPSRLLRPISTALNSLGLLLRGLIHFRANRTFTLADQAGALERRIPQKSANPPPRGARTVN